MNEVQIQIVNYKTKNYLLDALRTLSEDLAASAFSYSVLILENASGDDLSDVPNLFPELHISIRTSDKNLGFGGGHNLLAREADSRFLLLLNPDIRIIEPDTVSRLLEAAKKTNVQVIGPRLLTSENITQEWDHGELKGVRAQIALNSGSSYWKERTMSVPAAWVSGAVFLIDTAWFKLLEGFDEEFFLYKEEEDLCWRLREKEGKVLYVPSITVFHQGGVVAQKSEHMGRSIELFTKKHFQRRWNYHFLIAINKLISK